MSQSTPSRTIALCALFLILALYVVGIVSHGVIRHIVQTGPVWVSVALGFSGSRWTKWTALPPFLVWLALMVIIWLFLLGIRLIDGTFTAIEIAMTLVVGVSAVLGIATALRTRSGVAWAPGLGAFLLMACLQVLALYISFMPRVARDPW